MFTGGDDQVLARALFGEPRHSDATVKNVKEVGRDLRLNISKKFLVWIGVQEESTFSELPPVTRAAAPPKAKSTAAKDTPAPLPEQTDIVIPEGEPSSSSSTRTGEIMHP